MKSKVLLFVFVAAFAVTGLAYAKGNPEETTLASLLGVLTEIKAAILGIKLELPDVQKVDVQSSVPLDVNIKNQPLEIKGTVNVEGGGTSGVKQNKFVNFFGEEGITGRDGGIFSEEIDTNGYSYLWFYAAEDTQGDTDTSSNITLQMFTPASGWIGITGEYRFPVNALGKPIMAEKYRVLIRYAKPSHVYKASFYLTNQSLGNQ